MAEHAYERMDDEERAVHRQLTERGWIDPRWDEPEEEGDER